MGQNSNNNKTKDKRKLSERFRDFLKRSHITTSLLIIILVFVVCYACYIFSDARENGLSFFDVIIYNLLALAGNDYEFTETPAGRILGLIVLSLGVVALSTITGYYFPFHI